MTGNLRIGHIGQAEIHQFELPQGVDHDVGRFDVPVHDTVAVDKVQRFANREQVFQPL